MIPGTTELLMFPAALTYSSIARAFIPSKTVGNILFFVLLILTYVILKREEHEPTK